MQRPVLSNVSNNREMISTFLGYNHRVVQQAGEFFNTENITLDDYPMLSNRAPMNRYKYPEIGKETECEWFSLQDGTVVPNSITTTSDEYSFTILDNYYGRPLPDGKTVFSLDRRMTFEFHVRFISAMADKVIISSGPGDPTCRLAECGSVDFYVKSANDGKVLATFYDREWDYDYRKGYVEKFVPTKDELVVVMRYYCNEGMEYREQKATEEEQKIADDELKKKMLDEYQDDINRILQSDITDIMTIKNAVQRNNSGCMIKNGRIASVLADVLYYAERRYAIDLSKQNLATVYGKLQMLNFGTKILIFPYGLYFDTEEPGKGVLPLAFKATASKNLVCTMCTEDRTLHTRLYCGASKPAGAAVGTYVVRSNGDLRIVDEHGALVLLCAAAKWKRQDKDPGVGNYDFWLDTTGTTGSGLKKYSQGTLYRKEDGAWVAEDNVLFSNTWFYTFWLDTTNADAPVYKSYSSTADAWIALPVTYVHIDTTEIEDDVLQSVKAGDTIRLSPDDAFTTEWVNVHSVADDGSWMIVKGLLRAIDSTYHCPNRIEKVLPEFDFVTVSQNRVWGCKYGKDSAGKHINQIYASKLGDPTNWYCFENTASDSYALSLGDDEPFTGAVSLNDMPYFFKQNKIYGVYGGYPAAYQRIAIEDRGVENDCSDSLAVLNGAVFYKSLDGVCVFDGSTVTNISAALGNTRYTEANAGSSLGKYYISMKNETDGGYETFVYDLNTGLWVRLNGMRYLHFITDYTGSVYAMDPNCIFHELGRHNETALSGLKLYQTEDKVKWYAETGAIDFSYPDKKIVSRINLRAKIALDAVLKAFIQYDSSGQWIQMGVLTGNGTPKTEVLNIVPQACDHYALRLEGCGDVRVISIANTMTLGSDL
ncbi:MAG: hypothetical protein UF405_05030 [Acutalibacteraceae bacterium]|nr:hypothetical protein [Acutalibacteraceae bacterium]